MESQAANPDLLRLDSLYYLYFRGQEGGHDRIGYATSAVECFDGATWDINSTPVIDVGGDGDPDEVHALDPATVLVGDTVYLYYSAVSKTCPRSICVATSRDGRRFVKYSGSPVVIGGGPEIVVRDGVFYLYYWQGHRKGFQLHLARSTDGFSFAEVGEPVLPVGPPGAWDSMTTETPRIFCEGDDYFMMYCGSDRFADYPFCAGLAWSRDLITWQRYAENPVFCRGDEGAWDEGAIWFTTVENIEGEYYLWYEGYGGGTARTEQYGSYLRGGKSQIGLAMSVTKPLST